MERDPALPKVGSFSNYVFCYDNFLYVVGWNNSNNVLNGWEMALGALGSLGTEGKGKRGNGDSQHWGETNLRS
jgi:hypothetical protein